jgi:long-chain acyl-CoA synthetase
MTLTSDPSTLEQVLTHTVANAADKPAFTHDGVTLTFRQLDELSHRFAYILIDQYGLIPGDRVMVQLPNCLPMPIVTLGIIRAGLIHVPINPLYTAWELTKQAKDAEPRLWITTSNRADIVDSVCRETSIEHVIISDLFDFHQVWLRWPITLYLRWPHLLARRGLPGASLRQLLNQARRAARHWTRPQLQPDDLALLQYTGGTTGQLKAAQLSHRNLTANLQQILEFLGSHVRFGQERIIAALPLYHIFSFMVHILMSIRTGNHSILIHDPTRTQPLVKAFRRWRPTAFAGVNPLFYNLCRNKDFQQLDFESLHLTIAGGMALTPDVGRRWEQLTGGSILEGFGMSETSPVVSLNPPQQNRLGTIGLPLPRTEVRLSHANGDIIDEPDQPGELEVRGPQVMQGYWRQPEETQLQLGPDGWLKTGDLARPTAEGYLQIVGRSKNMILVSGFNVYPQEVEAILMMHPQITAAKVVGQRHPVAGEVVKAHVSATSDQLTIGQIRMFCRRYLAPYKIPRTIDFSLEQAEGVATAGELEQILV